MMEAWRSSPILTDGICPLYRDWYCCFDEGETLACSLLARVRFDRYVRLNVRAGHTVGDIRCTLYVLDVLTGGECRPRVFEFRLDECW